VATLSSAMEELGEKNSVADPNRLTSEVGN